MKKPKLAIDYAPSWVYSTDKIYWVVQDDDVENEFTGIAGFPNLELAKEYLKKVHRMKEEKIVVYSVDNEEEKE